MWQTARPPHVIMGTTTDRTMAAEGALTMSRLFKSALVVLAVIGSLALPAGSAIADGPSNTNTGGASGCCRTID